MANLTISVDDEVLRRARLRALENRTSVNALLREYLVRFAGDGDLRRQVVQDLLELAASAEAGSGGRRWSRDELHER